MHHLCLRSSLGKILLALALGLFSLGVSAQSGNSGSTTLVNGKVTDSKGEPLPGASVIVKGTAIGVATDIEGKFSLSLTSKAVAGNPVLVVSFVGMIDKEIPYKKFKNGSTIILEDDTNSLQDVVVTGYATIKKQSFTGTSTTVTKDELLKVSPTNLMKALSTFDPSFKMVTDNVNGSNPNNMAEYYVRGQSGISEVTELDLATSSDVSEFALRNNPSAPIYILDGFEVDLTTIYDMDINRIKSVTILKDAAATAVYGSRAANGVIVIETEAPEPGKIRVGYSNNTSFSAPDLSSYHMMNAEQALEAERLAGLFDGTDSERSAAGQLNYARMKDAVTRGIDTDWLSKPVRNSLSHKHSFYLNGGTQDIRWGADLGYNHKGGVMKGSSRDTYSGAMTIDYRYKTLQIKNKVTFNHMGSSDSPYGTFSDYVRMKPYLDPVDESTGSYATLFNIYRTALAPRNNPNVTLANPLYEASLDSFSKSKYNQFMDNFNANWNITKFLMFRGSFSTSYTITDNETYVDPRSETFTSGNLAVTERGTYRDVDIKAFSWNASGLLAYNRTVNKHNHNATIGVEAAENKSNSMTAQFKGFITGVKPSPYNALGVAENYPTYSDSHTRRFGTYLQYNYTWNDIYLADISGRYEGSSTFGSKKKMGTFWSAGLGLNVHNYQWVRDNLKWINRLKLKATYGVTGKANFSAFYGRDTYQYDYDSQYIDMFGMSLMAMGNENLKWEKVKKLDIGTELSIFNNRFTLYFDYYHEPTVDQVEAISIPTSSGFSSYYGNIGEVVNEGFDARMNLRAYSSKDWDVYLFGNINHNTNRITKIGDALKEYNSRIDQFFSSYSGNSTNTRYQRPFTKYEEGNSLSAIYGMKSLGIDPATGRELYVNRDGTVTYTWTSTEQQCLGDSEPDYSGSFGFNLRWRQWTLYTTFYYQLGGQAYNSTLVGIENLNLEYYNGDERALTDRWTKVGDVATLKSIEDRARVTRPTSRFVQDNNTLTFNSASLGYDFSRSLCKKIGISSLKLMLSTEDLAYFSTIRRERGTSYPYARTFNFTLNVTL